MKTDAELVDAVCGGERAAFGQLVRRYERAVRAVARGVLRDDDAAEDVAQETFLAAYRKLGGLRNGSAFGGWIVKIARREAIRMGRRLSRSARAAGAAADAAAAADGGLDTDSQRLLDAVIALPAQERTVVMMRYFEDRPVREIAEMLGRPLGTVTKQLSRAHERLRRRLKESQR